MEVEDGGRGEVFVGAAALGRGEVFAGGWRGDFGGVPLGGGGGGGGGALDAMVRPRCGKWQAASY
jgi:hypothetical protein